MRYDFVNGFDANQRKFETWYDVDVFLEHAYWHQRNVKAQGAFGSIIQSARDQVHEAYREYGINSNPYDSLKVGA